eukprot:CAMPEP_0205935984 /NCGR_PEP_ID=MMETSP1325-20131115/40362_1 /ASSEMBLY_ACC=CAM_ASM_000708 /TAXON_ID=236786 /ORGANISM="Florenciella sp., Strain RCC1007" /LENGTH=69 /DNA_ID=CAMNT_0053306103 /DNA_START=59 /DNA_END=265 /DNA_ORIENTATION=-
MKGVSLSVAWHKWRSHYHTHWCQSEMRRLRAVDKPTHFPQREQPGPGEVGDVAFAELEDAVRSLAEDLH